MPQPPDVTIARLDDGVVVAEAVDEFSAQLLTQQAGLHEPAGAGRYRLPDSMTEAEQQKRASLATRLLAREGYTVTVDPALGDARLRPDAPQDHYAAGRHVRDLTVAMNSVHTYARAKHHTDQVLHPDFGVLTRLGEFFEAAAQQAHYSNTAEGRALHDRFREVADTLAGLRDELDDASEEIRSLGLPRQLRELGPSEAPHWRDRVAQYHATAPKHPAAPTSGAGAAAPVRPSSSAPAPPRRHR